MENTKELLISCLSLNAAGEVGLNYKTAARDAITPAALRKALASMDDPWEVLKYVIQTDGAGVNYINLNLVA